MTRPPDFQNHICNRFGREEARNGNAGPRSIRAVDAVQEFHRSAKLCIAKYGPLFEVFGVVIYEHIGHSDAARNTQTLGNGAFDI